MWVRSERSSSQRSEMIDPRLEPNFGFDFFGLENRLDSVEFDSQGRVEGEEENSFIHSLCVIS